MRNIKVIIGANAGDEGKGLATDYFASQHQNGLVVMTNGGSQRAHTVELPDGIRHVFQHFGSGTFRGWDTYYSSRFILNPMQFCKEYDQIKSKYDKPFKIYASRDCMWSTPYDMIYNQIKQRLSGLKNTCGTGIWNTIQRYEDFENATEHLPLRKSISGSKYCRYIKRINNYYIYKVNKLIGNDGQAKELIADLYALMFDANLFDHFIADLYKMINDIIFDKDPFMIYNNIIFENGQGLLIDQDADIQYGTPSYTGIKIPKNIIRTNFHKEEIEVCYVTRSYLTRHGYGSLREEVNKDAINPFMIDQTNHENDFQGSLRFGNLYPNDLINRIDKDWVTNITLSPFLDFNIYKKSLMVTHLNEHDFPVAEIADHFENVYLSSTKYSKDVINYNNV